VGAEEWGPVVEAAQVTVTHRVGNMVCDGVKDKTCTNNYKQNVKFVNTNLFKVDCEATIPTYILKSLLTAHSK